uniref:Peptidase S1 domain-containing protein n=1 Tax=Anopheles culicifacies TaxID=139723 RepID=A0A182MN83_9DIPT
MELITCLANSSTLNVTTKHCDCETYSCKDLLASSSPSPLNYIQPRGKIHTSCREHCCRKKKFNRSIDPAALENVVASSHGSADRRYNTVRPGSSMVHRSPMGSLPLSASSTISTGMQPSDSVASLRLRTTGLPSPASVRDQRDRPAAVRACKSEGIDHISIANNRVRAPWLYRVGLIETKHPVCVGTLIHPSLILTTAVCVIKLTAGITPVSKVKELVDWFDGGGGSRVPCAVVVAVDERRVTRKRIHNPSRAIETGQFLLVLDNLTMEYTGTWSLGLESGQFFAKQC